MKPLPMLLLTCAGLALFSEADSTSAQAADAKKPNILLIVSDDHGYGDVGVLGCKDIPTPHMDSLARNGVLFTSGYVSGPYCSPTRAGLLTGRYQNRFGHEFNPGPARTVGREIGLPLGETILPQRLKAVGYKTGMIGKWHLGYDKDHHPLSRGFDEFFGFLGGAHSYVDARAGGANPILRGRQPVDETEYLTDAFRREALDFIDRHAQDTWFLYVPFNAVHGPMDAASRYLDRFPDLADNRKIYATMVTAMDDAIGAILEKLRSLHLEEQTLVFFVSDNGGPETVNASDNGPLRGQKGECWEGGIRVPLMIQWKGTLPAGQVYRHPVIQLDFVPTALAAAGVEASAGEKLDGVNLLPHLTGERTGAPHESLFWRFGRQMAVRTGDWKLVKAPGAGLEGRGGALRRDIVKDLSGAHLYNLADDIGETKNLAGQEPERVRRLAEAWQKWNVENADPLWYPGQGGRRRNRRAVSPNGALRPQAAASPAPTDGGA